MVEEVTSLKKDFKQKENKYLEEFLDMKALKEKVEDKLYKQDQSLQTVHMLCKPKPYYNEQNKALVHNTKDTLEIAEITRRKMNDKMKDPKCVTHKVKIAPPDYSKENYLATFTPQKQLTPKQIFWSQDLIKMKEEALKKQTTASRPIKALTVYPPNTPAMLVPRVLPTKSQTLKEHFEGIQKALTKEIKEINDAFEELEAELDQNVVDRKHDEIKRKNLLIANDNLIADCLSKEVFYVATNSELNVSRFNEMHDAHTIVEACCLELEVELSLKYQNLKERFGNNPPQPARDIPDFYSVFVIGKLKASLQGKDNITQLTEKDNVLQQQNELYRAENAKIKQHYKELYDSIKITRAKHLEQTTALLTRNESLKVQIQNKLSCVTKDHVKSKVLAPGKYAIDIEPIPPRNRNNREVHLDYLRHLKESVKTLREIVKEAKFERPLDRSIVSACRYTKHSQELVEYAIGTCPKDINQRDKKHAPTLLIRKKQVTFDEQCNMSNSTTYKHAEQLNTQKTNAPVPPSTGVNGCTDASRSQPKINTKKNRILPAKSVNKKKVEEHPRTNKSSQKKSNRVDSSISSKRAKPKQVWKATGKLLTNVGYQWKPTGRKFTLGEQCPLTRFTKSKVVPVLQTENISTSKIVITENLSHTSQKPLTRYQRRNKQYKAVPASIPTQTENQAIDASMRSAVAYADQQDPNKNWGSNFPNSPFLSVFECRNFMKKFTRVVRFENDHFGVIMGYGDYVIGDSVIFKVYYVEGLGHNLFSVRQFCDSDLEVAFRKHSCYVRDIDGVELIKGSRGSNLYTISVENMMKSSPICLLSKASKNKSWLWHRSLNHLNFGTINDLARKDLVRGLPRLKFEKDHLCSACQLGKSKKHTHKPTAKNTIMEVLHTLHIDLYGPMRVQSINGKKYILVIVDDYFRFTSFKFLRSKDETPEFQNDVVGRRNRTHVEAAWTILIFSKALIFLWAEAVAIAFFGALCYPTNDSKDLGKLQPTADIGIFFGCAPSRKG
ncbi:integrase, catalytic region, zinc finger, CCHC-type containing protein [Tanacetum coccineum]